jgi:hypothetical protein
MPNLRSISSTFYASIFCMKVFRESFFYLHVTREKLPKRLSYKKGALKMLIKLTLNLRNNITIDNNGPIYQSSQFLTQTFWNQWNSAFPPSSKETEAQGLVCTAKIPKTILFVLRKKLQILLDRFSLPRNCYLLGNLFTLLFWKDKCSKFYFWTCFLSFFLSS